MPAPAWLAVLRNKIEQLLSRQHLLRDPYLISQVMPYNLIPISAIAKLPSIAKFNATEADIIQCCCQSYNLDFLRIDNVAVVSPHYLIVPTILMVKDVKPLGTLFEFGDFVSSLAGESSFYAYPANDGNDYAVHFQYQEHCVAAWRALRIIPFRGQILDVEVFAPPQPFTITQTTAVKSRTAPEAKSEVTVPKVTDPKTEKAAPIIITKKSRDQKWAVVEGRNSAQVSV
jgi:hypothetical protein